MNNAGKDLFVSLRNSQNLSLVRWGAILIRETFIPFVLGQPGYVSLHRGLFIVISFGVENLNLTSQIRAV